MSENDHAYHRIDDATGQDACKIIREETIKYEKTLERLVPPGRDLSIAKTNLEQARMWAIAGIAKARPVA